MNNFVIGNGDVHRIIGVDCETEIPFLVYTKTPIDNTKSERTICDFPDDSVVISFLYQENITNLIAGLQMLEKYLQDADMDVHKPNISEISK